MNQPTNQVASLDDEAHQEALDDTGFWGTRGAGCLILCQPTQRFLLGLRSKDVEEPLTWSGFGGAIDSNENPRDAALREVHEETGLAQQAELYPLFTFRSGDFVYSNFLAVVQKEYKPKLDWETSRAVWRPWGDFPKPYHFGLRAILTDKASLKTIQRFLK